MKIFPKNPLRRSSRRVVTLAIFAAFAWAALTWSASESVRADESLELREQRISRLTASEKEELQRRRDRFDKLPALEKERMRALHQQIQGHQDSERLMTVLDHYSDWLRTISTSQRADLRKLPVEERIKRIRDTQRRREEVRFGQFMTERLQHEDARRVFSWLDDEFVAGKQEQLEEMVDGRDRRLLRMIEDDSRRRALMLKMLYRGNPDILGDPTPEQIKELVERLSPEAKKQFQAQADPQQQERLVQEWIQAAIMSRLAPPPVSEEELQEFFATLGPEQREELERLPRDRMHRELSRWYYMRNMMRRRQGGPPGQGPSRRFGGPRGRGGDFDRGRGRDRRPPPPQERDGRDPERPEE